MEVMWTEWPLNLSRGFLTQRRVIWLRGSSGASGCKAKLTGMIWATCIKHRPIVPIENGERGGVRISVRSCSARWEMKGMLKRVLIVGIAGTLLSGCNSNVLRTLGTATAGAVVGQAVMQGIGGGANGSASFGGSHLEGCDSPQALRDYLNQLAGASPGALGWGGLSGGVSTARKHCRTYQSIQPLDNEPCESIGYGYKACPAIADGSTRVWTVGRRPGVGTGLN